MPEISERETARGLRTLGNLALLDLVVDELSPSQIARIWNRHLAREASETLTLDAQPKTRVASGFLDSRRSFREAFRRTQKGALVVLELSGELRAMGEEPFSSILEPIEPAPTPKPPEPIKASRPLSALEQRMLLTTAAKTGNKPSLAVVDELDPEMARQLAAAADEARAQTRTTQDFIQWVCTQADALLAEHIKNEGEALWNEPVKLQGFPEDPTKRAIFVLSSTAPLLRDESGSPSVKHDFRANEQPVTHAHPEAFKQADGMKVIRSKVIKKGGHEYYVKALNYVNGMFFKGYFVVDGVENADVVPPRYYQVRGDRVFRISEQAYKTLQNRFAAGKPLIEDKPSVDDMMAALTGQKKKTG